MVQPKGNPNIADYHFLTDGDEQLTAKLSLQITPSMLEQIQSQENWQEFVREAIAEKIKQQQIETILKAFPDLALKINPQGLILESWGRNSDEVYALPVDLLEKPIEAVLSPSESEQFKKAIALLKTSKSLINLEYSLIIDNKEEFYEARFVKLPQDHCLVIIRNISERKRAEAILRENERLYRAIGETIDYGIWVCQADGRNIYASESFLNLVGITQQQCSDFGWGNVLHPDDAEQTIIAWKECSSTGSLWDREHRFRGVDGKWHPILARGAPVRDENGEILCWAGINLDISRLKETEEQLRESEARFRMLADSAPVLIWMNGSDGGCEFVNKAYLEFFGKTLEEVRGFGWRSNLHPDDEQQYMSAYLDALKNHQLFRVQARIKRADGQYRWLDSKAIPRFSATGQFLGYIGTSSDISEIKEVERALLQREQRFSTLFNGMEDWVLVYHLSENGQPGQLIEVNEQACKKLGYNREELLLMSVQDIIESSEINSEANLKKLQLQKHIVIESLHITKEGQLIPVEVSATLFTLNELPTVQAICRDITERKQIEQEREQLLSREQAAREAAESANRIKDEFLAVLSHELRSPLNPILGWAQMLNTYELPPETQQKALTVIERNARLQAELIEDLLDVSRILRGKLSLNATSVNLVDVIEAAIETVSLAAQAKKIQLKKKFCATIGQVLADPARLQQIVWNLLSNAVKFTPTEGQVNIELEKVGNWAQIKVTDTGKGITSEFLPHLFDYFRQADSTTTRKFGGLGLGLAIARHLVELHGGTIQAQSLGENQGSTFIVKLPLISDEITSNHQVDLTIVKEREKQILPLASCQILVVDDEVDTRDFLKFVLEKAGATVTTVNSANEALQALNHLTFDILLCDIGMPKTDGYTLIREIRTMESLKGQSPISAIALTAYAGETNRQKALLAGFQRHITKPVEPELLIKTVVDLMKS